MTFPQYLAACVGLLLLLGAAAALGSVFTLWLHDRPERKTKPTPKAARTNPTLTDRAVGHPVPRDPDPVIRIPVVDVTYRPADDATVVVQPAQTRFDLLKQHTERSIRARGSNG